VSVALLGEPKSTEYNQRDREESQENGWEREDPGIKPGLAKGEKSPGKVGSSSAGRYRRPKYVKERRKVGWRKLKLKDRS